MLALMAGACRVGLIALRAKFIRDPEKKSAMHTKVGHFEKTLAMVFRWVKNQPPFTNESKTKATKESLV